MSLKTTLPVFDAPWYDGLMFKTNEKVDEAVLQSLVDSGAMEGQKIDFKCQLYSHDEKGKKSLLADVAAMANSRGGVILFGIEEGRDAEGNPTGIAEQVIGLEGNLDKEKLWIQQVIRSGLEPPTVPTDLCIIQGSFPKGPVLLMRISHVYNMPVMIRQTRRFYVRRDSQNEPIHRVTELRRLFLAFEEHRDWVRTFRSERVAVLMQGEGPFPLSESPFLLCHLIPGEIPDDELGLDIGSLQKAQFPFFGGVSHIVNLDGIITFPATAPGDYGLAFRNGALEFVIDVGGPLADGGPPTVHGKEIDRWVRNFLKNAQHSYQNMEITLPAYLCLTLIGAKGSWLIAPDGGLRRTESVFDRDPVVIPEVMLSDWPTEPDDFRVILDLVWQAGGYSEDPLLE